MSSSSHRLPGIGRASRTGSNVESPMTGSGTRPMVAGHAGRGRRKCRSPKEKAYMTDREYGDADLSNPGADEPDYEFLIIGAGLTGLYQLHRLLQVGARVIPVDATSDVGGPWLHNRYPGCRR